MIKLTKPGDTPPIKMRTRDRSIAESVPLSPENTTMAIMHRVTDMGLITSATKQVGARLPTRLLERAKERTGLISNTDLIVFALANIAVEDNFAKAFARARGTVDADLEF